MKYSSSEMKYSSSNLDYAFDRSVYSSIKRDSSLIHAGTLVFLGDFGILTRMSTPATVEDASSSPIVPKPFSAKQVGRVLHDVNRWRILRELAKGEALPVQVLAQRIGRTSSATSKHMQVLREARLVVTSHGGHYRLAPAIRPAPGVQVLDLGHCTLRLDTPL